MPGRRDLFYAPKDLPFGVYNEQMGMNESNDLFPPVYFNKTPEDIAWCQNRMELMPSMDITCCIFYAQKCLGSSTIFQVLPTSAFRILVSVMK